MSGWERLSAQSGGTVAGLAVVGGSLFAATMAGVYVSADAGCTWTPTSRHQTLPFCEVIGSTGSAQYAGCRGGLYCSEDSGQTWRHVLTGGRVLSLALRREVVLVGTEADGILRSEDGGRTFSAASAGLLDRTIVALALSPAFERDGTGFAGTPSGVYRTRNGAKSWRTLDVDPPVQCLWLSPRFAEDQLVLAGTESEGLLRSDDAGAHWNPVPEFVGRDVSALAISSNGTLAAATDRGVAISHDQRSWSITSCPYGPPLALAFAPSASGEVLVAGLAGRGIARASEPFTDWTQCDPGLRAPLVVSLALSPAFAEDQTVFAAGPDVGVIVSNDSGRTWDTALTVAADLGAFGVTVSPDGAVFAAAETGVQRSVDGGATWHPFGQPIGARSLIAARDRLLAVSMQGDLLLLDEKGAALRKLGDSLGIGTEVVSATLAADGTLFAATLLAGELTLWRSVDAGVQWQSYLVERTESACSLAASPNYSVDQQVYVGFGSRVLTPIQHTRETRSGEQRPLWRSVDLGASVAALDATRSRIVYAATSDGVEVSRDGGQHFSPLLAASGDGPTATVAVAVSPNYAHDHLVYALEIGGVLWRLEDAI